MQLPPPRGPLSGWVIDRLRGADQPAPDAIPELDDDFQLALWCCYELHYRGFDGIAPDADWDPQILAFRAELEKPFTSWLQQLTKQERSATTPVADQLRQLIDEDDGPSLAAYLHRHATRDQFREFLLNRSVYQLKEADPHSYGIPRLDGAVKAALVEIQADEYGGGRADRMHAELFRTTMRWLDLDDTYGRYVPDVPGVTLALSNAMSLFALHSRWTGALLGHLAALEMTSTLPNRRYASGAARLGATEEQARYFTEHVEADAVHEQIAAHDLCGQYAEENPDKIPDILFGAACCLALDNLVAEHLLTTWHAGQQRQVAG
ncbi:iron-containing redox enzyme family protein [Kribbella endophytica]